jgi:hypothetical protein
MPIPSQHKNKTCALFAAAGNPDISSDKLHKPVMNRPFYHIFPDFGIPHPTDVFVLSLLFLCLKPELLLVCPPARQGPRAARHFDPLVPCARLHAVDAHFNLKRHFKPQPM